MRLPIGADDHRGRQARHRSAVEQFPKLVEGGPTTLLLRAQERLCAGSSPRSTIFIRVGREMPIRLAAVEVVNSRGTALTETS